MADRSASDAPVPARGRSLDCAGAEAYLARFATSSPAVADDRAFRTHVLRCAACRTAYRETVAGLARARRAARDQAPAEAPRVERQVRRRRTIARTVRRSGGWRLKTVLIPAGLIVLFCGLPLGVGGGHLDAHWEVGGVEAGGLALGPERPSAELERGEGCATHGQARAWLEGHGGRFRLGPATRVFVEDAREPWVRLQSGSLEAEGSLRVGAQLGLIELDDARASVRLEGRRVVVECLEGRAIVRNAGLERTLRAGQRAELGLGEIVVEPSGS